MFLPDSGFCLTDDATIPFSRLNHSPWSNSSSGVRCVPNTDRAKVNDSPIFCTFPVFIISSWISTLSNGCGFRRDFSRAVRSFLRALVRFWWQNPSSFVWKLFWHTFYKEVRNFLSFCMHQNAEFFCAPGHHLSCNPYLEKPWQPLRCLIVIGHQFHIVCEHRYLPRVFLCLFPTQELKKPYLQ